MSLQVGVLYGAWIVDSACVWVIAVSPTRLCWDLGVVLLLLVVLCLLVEVKVFEAGKIEEVASCSCGFGWTLIWTFKNHNRYPSQKTIVNRKRNYTEPSRDKLFSTPCHACASGSAEAHQARAVLKECPTSNGGTWKSCSKTLDSEQGFQKFQEVSPSNLCCAPDPEFFVLA